MKVGPWKFSVRFHVVVHAPQSFSFFRIIHLSMDWKCAFYGVECGFCWKWMCLSRTSGVKLYNLPLWAHAGSRLIHQCKRWASKQSQHTVNESHIQSKDVPTPQYIWNNAACTFPIQFPVLLYPWFESPRIPTWKVLSFGYFLAWWWDGVS